MAEAEFTDSCRPRSQQKIALFHDIKEEDDDCKIDSSLDDTSDLASADGISETASSSATSDATIANPSNEVGASVYLRLRPVDCPTSTFAISKEGNVLICSPPHEPTNLNKNLAEKHYSFTDILDSHVRRCLDAASAAGNKTERVPFRESKLTMLLQTALQGREKLTMIVNLTPLDKYYEENCNVLNFASIARNIIFKSSIAFKNHTRCSNFSGNTRFDIKENDKAKDEYIQDLAEENARLHEELQSLRAQLEEKDQFLHNKLQQLEEVLRAQHSEEMEKQEGTLRNKLVDWFKVTLAETKKQNEERLQVQLSCQAQIYEMKIASLTTKYKAEIEDLEEELERQE
uniref:Kinesin motor domain-containing protein n=1 Tax=Glossina palpalis gambiensis TaxID=67801 RepID=A0A1B0APH0_9MUSC